MELKTYFAQDAAGNIISSAVVNVFLQGTTTLATGLTRADGTPLDNPFAADGAGRIQFRAPDGYYDVQVSAGLGIIQTLTIQCVDYSGAKADADRAEVAADRADVSAEQAQNALNSLEGVGNKVKAHSGMLVGQNNAYRFKVLKNIPFISPDYNSQLSFVGAGATIPYPQGMAVDWVRNELFIIRNMTKANVVEVYDFSTFEYKQCFFLYLNSTTMASAVSEGIIIKYEGSSRKLYTRAVENELHRFDVTILPANMGIVTSEFIAPVPCGMNFDYKNGQWYLQDPTIPVGSTGRRCVYTKYKDDFTRLTSLNFGIRSAGAIFGDYNGNYISKAQGICVTPGGILFSIGGRNNTDSDYRLQGLKLVSGSGEAMISALYTYAGMINKLTSAGVTCNYVEHEGAICEPSNGNIYSIVVTTDSNVNVSASATGGILITQEFSSDDDAIDMTEYAAIDLYTDVNGWALRSGDGNLYNPVTGELFTSWSQILPYMKAVDRTEFSYYTSSVRNILDTASQPLPSGFLITIENGNNGTFFVRGISLNATRWWRILMNSDGTYTQTEFTHRPYTNFLPVSDNLYTLGRPDSRWTVVYATTGTINTSDARYKEDVTNISDAEMLVAKKIKGMIKRYKFSDAIAIKGDNSRYHFGVLAQEVKKAFEEQGLVAEEYGILCYDEWEEIPAQTDENGIEISASVPAGNRYGIRYDELICFIIAAI